MTYLWRPRPGGAGAMLWYRCDNCHYSGDAEHFVELFKDNGDRAQICTHFWCWSHVMRDQYAADGWRWAMETFD